MNLRLSQEESGDLTSSSGVWGRVRGLSTPQNGLRRRTLCLHFRLNANPRIIFLLFSFQFPFTIDFASIQDGMNPLVLTEHCRPVAPGKFSRAGGLDDPPNPQIQALCQKTNAVFCSVALLRR